MSLFNSASNLFVNGNSVSLAYLNGNQLFNSQSAIVTPIVTVSLILSLDAGNVSSYPGSGTTWTDTIGGKVFTLAGSPSLPTYNSSNGGYINFTAAAQQYASATSFASILSTYTIEVWHLFTGTSTGTAPVLFGEARSSYSNFMIGRTGSTTPLKIQGGFYNGAWQQGTTNPDDYYQPSNGWHQFVNTYDGSNIKFYANNILQLTKTPSDFTIARSGLGLNIMRRQDAANNHWGGGVSIIRVYDTALDSTQITQNYNAQKSRFGL